MCLFDTISTKDPQALAFIIREGEDCFWKFSCLKVSRNMPLVGSMLLQSRAELRHKKKMWQLRERYIRPQDWGKKKLPTQEA